MCKLQENLSYTKLGNSCSCYASIGLSIHTVDSWGLSYDQLTEEGKTKFSLQVTLYYILVPTKVYLQEKP